MTLTAKQIGNARTLVQAAVTEMSRQGFSQEQIAKEFPRLATEAVRFLAEKGSK